MDLDSPPVTLACLHITQVVFLTGRLSSYAEIERLLTKRKPVKATAGLVLRDRPIAESSGLTGLLSNLTHCSGRHFNHWKITGYGSVMNVDIPQDKPKGESQKPHGRAEAW